MPRTDERTVRGATCTVDTLGCKVNQYEAQALREALVEAGLRPVDADEGPDVYVLNTCSVTHGAEREARRLIRRARRRNPGARVVVTGCYATREEETLADLPVDLVVKNDSKHLVAERILDDIARGTDPVPAEEAAPVLATTDPGSMDGGPGDAGSDEVFELGVSDFGGRTRAFVKVQDGCEVFCTFCIIPHLRGTYRSRPPGEILEEVRRLAASGYREIVIAGVCLGHYGTSEPPRFSLPEVLARTAEVDGVERVRLSSIEATGVTPELLDAMAGVPEVVPHLHLPLQSGSNRVLRWMNRRPSADGWLELVGTIRDRLDRPAISTDIICGFPKEEPSDLEATLEVAREAELMRIHVFPYSDRPGTAAAAMEPKVPPPEIKRRRDALLELADELALAWKRRFEGERAEVMVEERRDRSTGKLTGYTARYMKVLLDGPDELMGEIVPVRLGRATDPDTMPAELLPS